MVVRPEASVPSAGSVTFATYAPNDDLAELAGFAAFRALQRERLTPYELQRLAPLFAQIEACNIPYAVAFVLALGGPFAAVGPEHAGGLLSILGEVVALIWFATALDPKWRDDWMIVRWPGATTLICLASALAVVLSHGRGGVAVWLLSWSLPGMVQLLRYRTARRALLRLSGLRRKVAALPTGPTPSAQ